MVHLDMNRNRVMSEACKFRGQRGIKLTRIGVISRGKWPLYMDTVRWIENKTVDTQNVCKRVRSVQARQMMLEFRSLGWFADYLILLYNLEHYIRLSWQKKHFRHIRIYPNVMFNRMNTWNVTMDTRLYGT